MNYIFKYFHDIFQAKNKTYIIDQPIDEVAMHIKRIPGFLGFWSTEDLELQYFRVNEFLVHSFSFPWSKGASSRLHGILINTQDKTTISTKIKIRYGVFISLVIFLTIGVSFSYRFLREPNVGSFFSAVIVMIIIPAIIIWSKQYADAVINQRFKKYLSKKFNVTEL